eukprot:4059954-Alexandrium_andersonii.AAC.1
MVGAEAEAVGAGLEPRRAPRAHTSACMNQRGVTRARKRTRTQLACSDSTTGECTTPDPHHPHPARA